MIFPNLEVESVVQVSDKTRLSALKSYVTPDSDPISKIEIKPEASGDFIDVTSLQYLDWQYSTAGDKVVTVKVTISDGGVVPVTDTEEITKTISVLSVADDYLFSSDSMLISHEPDILKWVVEGRSSFLNVHREAQNRILSWLDEKGHTLFEGEKITKESFVDVSEVREWSKFLTLQLIFEGMSNGIDDVFKAKARKYEADMQSARNRAFLRYDWDSDGEVDDGEFVSITSIKLVRR